MTHLGSGVGHSAGAITIGTACAARVHGFGTSSKRVGNGLSEYTWNVTFNANGIPVRFTGNATDYVGGAPAFGLGFSDYTPIDILVNTAVAAVPERRPWCFQQSHSSGWR